MKIKPIVLPHGMFLSRTSHATRLQANMRSYCTICQSQHSPGGICLYDPWSAVTKAARPSRCDTRSTVTPLQPLETCIGDTTARSLVRYLAGSTSYNSHIRL